MRRAEHTRILPSSGNESTELLNTPSLTEQDTHVKLGVTKTSPAHRYQTEGNTHASPHQTLPSPCPVAVLHIAHLLWALVRNLAPALSQTHNATLSMPGPLAVTHGHSFSCSPQAVSACLPHHLCMEYVQVLCLATASSSVKTVPFLKSPL